MNVGILYKKSRKIISSKSFFLCILAIFAISALWLVFSARYPMAFDENYHYGIIQQYAHQWSPFITQPPAHAESLGDITRYPSYLYHYLMSFPYRLISLFTRSDTVKIISLRLFSVGMWLGALVLFRKAFLRAHLSAALTNLALLFYILIPNFLFLSAHISYDNMLILLTAWIFLLMVDFINGLKKGSLDVELLLKIAIVNLFASITKYTHLPVFLAIAIFILIYTPVMVCRKKIRIMNALKKSFMKLSLLRRVLLVSLLILGLGLFLERYAVNYSRYGSIVPACDSAMSVSICQHYGPWIRDHNYMQNPNAPGAVHWNIGVYSLHWIAQEMYELFFTINYNYANLRPLLLPFITAWVILISGVLLVARYSRKLFENLFFMLFGLSIATYGVTLFFNNYFRFIQVHHPVALHGRYFAPLGPLILILFAYAFYYAFHSYKRYAQILTLSMGVIAFILFTQGGGVVSFILSSDESWYWPSQSVRVMNREAKRILQKVVIPTRFPDKV